MEEIELENIFNLISTRSGNIKAIKEWTIENPLKINKLKQLFRQVLFF